MEQNLSGYKIFYEVASCGNISKAAKELYISQPAISKSIVKLEDSLETRLFNRNSRGVSLTEEGEILYSHIKNAFESINAAEAELKRMKEFNIGHIRIGVSTTLCRYILLPYLKHFIEQNPNIRISIETMATAQTMQALEQKKIDIGLVAAPGSCKPEIQFHTAMEIHDVFVASPSYMENIRAICGEDMNLFDEANIMLLDRNNMTRRHIDQYFKSMEIEPVQTLEVTTMDLLIEFARIGMGVACVIRELVLDELENGTLLELPLELPIPARTIGFAYNTANRSKSLEAFLNLL